MPSLTTELINEVSFAMKEQDVTRSELAERIGVSPGRVAQMLSGGEDLTVAALSQMAQALNREWVTVLMVR